MSETSRTEADRKTRRLGRAAITGAGAVAALLAVMAVLLAEGDSRSPRSERFASPAPSASPATPRVRPGGSLTVVGALRLGPFGEGVHGDVAGYRQLAFIGKWRGPCPGTGVDIIDVSDPSSPAKISDTADHADTSMEDMEATTIGRRDVLAVGLQDCGGEPDEGKTGLELHDITNPRKPKVLAFYPTGAGGVHELDVTVTPGGRTLALLAVPGLEASTAGSSGEDGRGDLLIVDISEPARPRLISEWGVLGEPSLGPEFFIRAQRGSDARTLLHSARANRRGTLAYLSYWDAGVITLDITDPAAPEFLGRTSYLPGEEGNAHSVDEAAQGRILVEADEDFSPFAQELRSSAFAGGRPFTEASFAPKVGTLSSRAMEGEVVYVGRGCPGGPGGRPADRYEANPEGRVALIERGACRFDQKVARAQTAGAVGVIVFNREGGLVRMDGEAEVTLSAAGPVDIDIPALFVGRSTGLSLRGADGPVTVRAGAVFDGWGYVRIFDVADPARPELLGRFATPHTNDRRVVGKGTWSVHNPEVVGSTLYASWYSDGVRVIDISDPSRPSETASWRGAGAPAGAPAVNIWSVVPHRGVLLVSDRNFGLYVLRLRR